MACSCDDKCSCGFVKVGSSTGKPGANILFDSGAPADTLGVNRDVYIDNDTEDLYKKEFGTWVLQTNIKGDKGDQGDIGPEGPKGEIGAQGATGSTGPAGVNASLPIGTIVMWGGNDGQLSLAFTNGIGIEGTDYDGWAVIGVAPNSIPAQQGPTPECPVPQIDIRNDLAGIIPIPFGTPEDDPTNTDYSAEGNKGGAYSKKIEVNNLPNTTLPVTGTISYTDSLVSFATAGPVNGSGGGDRPVITKKATHDLTANISSPNNAFDVRAPYKVIYYIQKYK